MGSSRLPVCLLLEICEVDTDTGLGFERTEKFVLLEVVSRPRSKADKIAFYENLCHELASECAVSPSDLMISFVENTDEDWSFGHGRAQFLEGDL
ncbi:MULTISPECIES: tautomerase family protein [Sinorhizobium]|uniref:tautomerase family protein n=1 Tax=Sinorhizobium TaxID=28105 RepID=UPI001F0ADB2F|nr:MULTISPECIES: tautomerase family protein [Sinorhizobium]